MRIPRLLLACLVALVLLVPAAASTATAMGGSGAQTLIGKYAGIWKAKTLQPGQNGATFRFKVNTNNRVRWVKGQYTTNTPPSCMESWTFELRNQHAAIDSEGRFVVRGTAGLFHRFVIRGTMVSAVKAKGRLRIGPLVKGPWGCAGIFRFTWRGHKL